MKPAETETRAPRHPWEPLQEVGLLVLDLADYTPAQIARRLPGPKRSARAVRVKLCRLRKRRRIRGGKT